MNKDEPQTPGQLLTLYAQGPAAIAKYRERSLYYRLDENRNVVPEPDMMKAMQQFENPGTRRVARDEFDEGQVVVSTVFLVMDHGFALHGDEPPIVFETMILDARRYLGEEEYQTRCSTWVEALEMHETAVAHLVSKMHKSSKTRGSKSRRRVLFDHMGKPIK